MFIVSNVADNSLASSAVRALVLQSSLQWILLADRSAYLLQPDPEPTKAKLEAFLEERGIPYKYGTTTKFANFRKRTLD